MCYLSNVTFYVAAVNTSQPQGFFLPPLGLNCLRLPLQSSYIDRHFMTLRFNGHPVLQTLPCQVDGRVKLLDLSISAESQWKKKLPIKLNALNCTKTPYSIEPHKYTMNVLS